MKWEVWNNFLNLGVSKTEFFGLNGEVLSKFEPLIEHFCRFFKKLLAIQILIMVWCNLFHLKQLMGKDTLGNSVI